MATIQEEILEAFFATLAESSEFDSDRIDRLRDVFLSDKKPKAVEVTGVLASNPGEDAT